MTTDVHPKVRAARIPARLLGATLVAALVLALADVLAFVRGAPSFRLGLWFVVYLVAAAVVWSAARVFEPGDHLRSAWQLLSANLLLIGSLALFPDELLVGPHADERARWAASLVTVVANGCGVVGMTRFALVAHRAGLRLPMRAWQQLVAIVALLVTALAAVGPDVVAMARAASTGDVWAGAALIADLCDLTLMLLFVPVLLTAWTFLGGSLAWPFGFLAGSLAAWVAFDGFQTYQDLLGFSPVAARFVSSLLHRLAALLVIAAAVAQRVALRRTEGASRQPAAW
jgi:hypothetical protein